MAMNNTNETPGAQGAGSGLTLLIINPGSTSTKISVFKDTVSVFEDSIFHDAPLLLSFPHVNDQIPFRYQVILDLLKEHGFDPAQIDAFVGRGGSAYSQPGGVTLVDERLYNDTVAAVGGSEHPAKLGVMLAWEFAKEFGKKAYTLNPTNTYELCDYARLTGIKGMYRDPGRRNANGVRCWICGLCSL